MKAGSTETVRVLNGIGLNGMKKCTQCGNEYPETRKHFGHTPAGNYRNTCRLCVRKNVRIHSEKNADNVKLRQSRRASQISGRNSTRHLERLLHDQNYKCYYCNIDLMGRLSEVDHKNPVSRGGGDSFINLAACCVRCNREKHNKTENEYQAWKKKVGWKNCED